MALTLLNGSMIAGGLRNFVAGLFGVQDPTISINGYGVEQFSTNHAFLDISKQMGHWGGTGNDIDTLIANGDAEGNEGWITATTLPVTLFKTLTLFEGNEYMNGRQFRMRWTGAGQMVAPAGSTVDSSSANEIVFTAPNYDMSFENYMSVSTTSGPISSLEIVDTRFTDRYDAGERLNPDYLEFIKDVRDFRFMDWNHTNGSTQDEWNTRPVVSQSSYSTEGSTTRHKKGVPLEIMVELCNKIKANMWFNYPASATNEYITEAATYINANLNAELTCTFELTNEPWNFFNNRAPLAALSDTLWPNASGDSEFSRGMAGYIYRSWEMAGLVDPIMSRNRFVLNASLSDQLTNQIWIDHWADANSTSEPYENPFNRIGYWAITGYFGLGIFSDSGRATAIESAYPATSDSVIDGYLRTPGTDTAEIGTLQGVTDAWTGVNSYCVTNGIKMVQYEGGCHMVYNNMSQTRVDAVGQYLNSSLGAAFATDLMDVWATMSEAEGPFMQFQDIGPWTGFGVWTLVDNMNDTPQGFFSQIFTEGASRGNWWGDTTDYRHTAI